MVDPTKVCTMSFICFLLTFFQEQESIYGLLFNLQTELMQKLQDGVVARDVYQHAVSYIREKKPELEQHFVRSVGFGVRAWRY